MPAAWSLAVPAATGRLHARPRLSPIPIDCPAVVCLADTSVLLVSGLLGRWRLGYERRHAALTHALDWIYWIAVVVALHAGRSYPFLADTHC